MKNLRLLMLALLVAGGVKAQYYQHTYGSPRNEVLESGVNTVGVNGKLMAGYSDLGAPGLNSVMVTRTTPAGVVGPFPTFNNGYFMFNPYTGAQLNAQARRVVELTNGRIGVWGDYNDVAGALPNRFFYMELTNNGIVVVIRSYALNYTPLEVQATSMVESTSSPDTLFVCGYAVNTAGSRVPVIMRIATGSGNIIWAWDYQDLSNPGSDWIANDLEESPYPTTTFGRDIALVGRYANPVGALGDGCFFTVSTVTGFPTNFTYLYGVATTEENLNGICIANNGLGTGPGFAVCGSAFNSMILPASFSTWAMKVNPNGSVVNWSTLIDYSIAGMDDFGYDIIERFNTAFAFEYFVGGYVVGGLFGGNDAITYKLNAAGWGPMPPPGNQFTYGGPGMEDARQLGQENAAPVGLSVFANTNGSFPVAPGAADFYLVKSYFNGITACNMNVRRAPFMNGPVKYDSIKFDTAHYLKADTIIHQPIAFNNVNLCFAAVVAGGNNARMANPATTSISELYPNPVSADEAVVNITFSEGGTSREIEIELWNTLGQLCLQRKISVAEGQTQLRLDLGTGLSTGIYHLMIREGEDVKDFKLSVQ